MSIYENINGDHKVVIREPFPALNTTDAFMVDARTAKILREIFLPLTRKGLNIVIEGPVVNFNSHIDVRVKNHNQRRL